MKIQLRNKKKAKISEWDLFWTIVFLFGGLIFKDPIVIFLFVVYYTKSSLELEIKR